MSFANPRPGGNAAYIKHILEAGHGSVLEHAVWNFIITGVSRSLTHELVRHRAGFAYSQLSQRYVDESEGEYVLPPDLLEGYTLSLNADFTKHCHWAAERYRSWYLSVLTSHHAYVDLVEEFTEKAFKSGLTGTEARKYARQAARSVLPNATETKIFVTANARALRHFLEQRGSRFAEPEIRRLVNHLLEILVVEAPNIFGDYTRTELPDGTFEIDTPYRKV
jgi:thymidylate synthase (FAD)